MRARFSFDVYAYTILLNTVTIHTMRVYNVYVSDYIYLVSPLRQSAMTTQETRAAARELLGISVLLFVYWQREMTKREREREQADLGAREGDQHRHPDDDGRDSLTSPISGAISRACEARDTIRWKSRPRARVTRSSSSSSSSHVFPGRRLLARKRISSSRLATKGSRSSPRATALGRDLEVASTTRVCVC